MTQDHAHSIEETLRDAAQKIRRSTRRGWIVMAALVIALSGWLTWLHGQFAEFDAKAVADLAETRARNAMPGAAEELQQRLEEAAPDFVAQVSERVLESPAFLREHMVSAADVWIEEMGVQVELALAELPEGSGDMALAELDELYPGLTREQQLQRLMEDLAREVRLRVAAVLTGPTDIYGETLGNIEAELERLSDPTGLTQRELLHREILVTAIQLAKYEAPESL